MDRKNLGIIEIEIPEIELDNAFGALSSTKITNLLSSEQILAIKESIKGKKLIYVSLNGVSDNDGHHIGATTLIPCYLTSNNITLKSIIIPPLPDDDDVLRYLQIIYYIESGIIEIYS